MLSKLTTTIIGKIWKMLGFAEITVWGIFVRKLLEGLRIGMNGFAADPGCFVL